MLTYAVKIIFEPTPLGLVNKLRDVISHGGSELLRSVNSMSTHTHIHYLQQALTLAQKGRGFCAPNPAVGAVIVKNQRVIATGYHSSVGKAHAEAEALKQLSQEESAGSVVYVTLEPCCHQGRTPPCTKLLIERGVKAVYYGFDDPNPLVFRQGRQQLQDAGIDCIHCPLPEIDAFYQSYAYWTKTQYPLVTAKLAMSLDGKIAGLHGKCLPITGKDAELFTHQWRKQSDAILTTVKTVIQDDPQLNVRLGGEILKKPIYILDTHLAFPKNAKLLNTAEKITLFHGENADEKRKDQLESKGVHCVPIPLKGDRIAPHEALAYIGQNGIHDLLLEAGGICFESLVLAEQVHRAFVYVALKWLGAEAQSAFSHNTTIFAKAKQLQWRALGEDAICEFTLK